ncbi:MAG: N-succinylarginine dihydrolase [Parasphingorhabdus sp.]|uniref:N-succinylarginine dihydrolase n=1 Tax=Parasphingorhabdus sp. TaxID=2709688 RepID=UPI0030017058
MSKLQEINFDGIIGPSHNYAGLSLGNIASSTHSGEASYPREAALQGIAKMRHNLGLGLAQGFFMPLDRPNTGWLKSLGTDLTAAEPHLRAAAYSASSMWAANAATVSPTPDSDDGKCHLTVANLMTMPHRSHEWPGTLAQLKIAFANSDHFVVHQPVPTPFGDEGAANHMRLCSVHDEAGVEIFVYGKSGGPFPARQHVESSKAVARRHGLDQERILFAQQSEKAIAAGAFHNDVVAVANERVLFAHEDAFEHREDFYAELLVKFPEAEIITVPADQVSLSDAIKSYLFNAQLVTLPNNGGMALILPTEAKENAAVWTYLQQLIAGNGSIRTLYPVNVRQSMANGGGPACLRLRVVADPAAVDPRFIATSEKLETIAQVVEQYWPKTITPDQLADIDLLKSVGNARRKLLQICGLMELAA